MFWSICFVILVLIEIAIPTLVSIWFAISALIMVFISPLIPSQTLQFLVFAVIALLLLLYLRKVTQKYFKPKDKLRKEEVLITRVLSADNGKIHYDVKYKGSVWSAYSKDTYKEGDAVFIKSFEGNKIVL